MDEATGWSVSASSRSSVIVLWADTGSAEDSVDTTPPTSGGGLSEIRRRGAAGKLARLLLTGPDGLDGRLARSGRVAKHWATLTPLSFKIRLVSSSSWCSFSHLRLNGQRERKNLSQVHRYWVVEIRESPLFTLM